MTAMFKKEGEMKFLCNRLHEVEMSGIGYIISGKPIVMSRWVNNSKYVFDMVVQCTVQMVSYEMSIN